MRIAIFSDVHSNLPALEAVLSDIRSQSPALRICLGDVVGYNAEPAECVERVREISDTVLLGNHDAAVAGDVDLSWFNPMARSGLEYSREHLSAAQVRYLNALPLTKQSLDWTCVHASLWEPNQWDYVNSAPTALMHFREQVTPIAFCGHTHRPVIWTISEQGLSLRPTPEPTVCLDAPGKHLVNVGAVGQPRDGDPRACYVIFDTEAKTVEFRRIEYDVAAEQKAIRAAKLPEMLAARLEIGR